MVGDTVHLSCVVFQVKKNFSQDDFAIKGTVSVIFSEPIFKDNIMPDLQTVPLKPERECCEK